MPPQHNSTLEEIHRLTQENNRLLHKMRRSARWSMLFTLIFYAALLLAPIWFYFAYLNGAVESALKAYDQMRGTGSQAANEFGQLQNLIRDMQQKLQQFASTSTPSR